MKVVIVMAIVISVAQSARILGIFPFYSKSHYIVGSALMRGLAENGHNVTVISPFGERDKVNAKRSYRDIVLNTVQKPFHDKNSNNMFESVEVNPLSFLLLCALKLSELGELTFQNKEVQQLVHSGEKFDAVIIEQFYDDGLKALAWHLGGVQILLPTTRANYGVDSMVGNPFPLSYVSDTYLEYSSQMTFPQRLMNTMMFLLNEVVHHFYLFPKYNRYIQKFLPKAPHINNFLYNASLVLSSSHPSLTQPMPHVPNMVEIGGFHIKPPKELPEHLQKFLDEATNGVIYFSMGSTLKCADLPIEKRTALLKSFSKLKQKIIWKWEEEDLPGKPGNVLLLKWCPQHAILAHPNVKLFITQGGGLSTTETVYFGVPVLTIPIFADQKLNAKMVVINGFGVNLPFTELTEESLTEKLNEALNNSKYTINAKTRSKIFHSRPKTPMETALYWVEYAIRHGGVPHLRVLRVGIPWYQDFLDGITFMMLIIVPSVIIIICFKRLSNKLIMWKL